MLKKDSAICIRAVDYSETSQIVTFFTRESGKISAIAKGSKRQKSAFDGPIELLSHGWIVFSDSAKEKLNTLTEFQQKPAFSAPFSNLFASNCAFLAVELVDKLTGEHDPHPRLFDSFQRFLDDLNGAKKTRNVSRETLSFLVPFQLSLLKEIGLQPVLNACVNCKTGYGSSWPQVYFSSSANGLICRDCEANFPDKIKLTNSVADCFNDLKRITQAEESTLKEVEKILISHFTHIMGKPPKMAKHIVKKMKVTD